VPELDVVARVFQDVLELVGVHLADGLGRDAHDKPARRDDLAGRHQRAGPHLGALLHDRAVEHDGADADAHVVHDPAGVDDGAMADRDEVADDARELRRYVQHGVVLHVRVAAERDVVVLVAAQDGEGQDRGAGPDRHVADHGGLRVDVGVGIDSRPASGHLADHGVASLERIVAPLRR
jgi:hypothetical protein